MASPAKRLKQSTIDALQEKTIRRIVIGTFVLPAGVDRNVINLLIVHNFLFT